MNIIDRININYEQLSKVQKLIAEYITANPEQVCFLSLKEFSEAVGTTGVSVLRFARKLGLDNYIGLKKETQAYVSQRLTPNDKLRAAIAVNRADRHHLISEVFDSEIANLRRTREVCSHDDILSAVELLKQADNVYLAAFTISRGVCEFLNYRLNSLAIRAMHFDIHETRMMTMRLANVTPKDLFIIVSVPRYPQELLFLAEQLKARGIPFICITDSLTAPYADYATVTLACANETLVFFNTYSPLMAVANVLVSVAAMDVENRVLDMQAQVNELQQQYDAGQSRRKAKLQKKQDNDKRNSVIVR